MYKKAIILSPEYFHGHNNLGNAYLKQGFNKQGYRRI